MKRTPASRSQRGTSLIVVMLMLIVVMSLSVSAAQIALQGEKVARNDRDRQIAFQAAEAALMDAEQDIEASRDAAKSRSELFASENALGFIDGCGNSGNNLGLCTLNEVTPAWLNVDFMDQSSNAHSVPYGKFTGQSLQTEHGSLPGRLPRYIIEWMRDSRAGQSAEEVAAIYRITAIGFGMRNATQVVLQTVYKKERQ